MSSAIRSPNVSSAVFFYFKMFSNSSYFMLATPYRIIVSEPQKRSNQHLKVEQLFKKNLSLEQFGQEVTPTISIKTHKLHKTICFLIHAYVLYFYIRSFYEEVKYNASPHDLLKNPRRIYNLISFLAFLVAEFLNFHLTWTMSPGLPYLYRSLYQSVSSQRSSRKMAPKGIILLPIILVLGMGGTTLLAIVLPILMSEEGFEKFLQRFRFFLFLNGRSADSPFFQSEYLDQCLTYAAAFLGYCVILIGQWKQAFVYLPCIAMYQIGWECRKLLKLHETTPIPIQFLIDYYKMLKRLTSCMNKIFGPLLLVQSIMGCVLLSNCLMGFWTVGGEFVRQSVNFANMVTFLTVYTTAAYGSEQVQGIGDYLLANEDAPEYARQRDRCIMLLLDIQRGPIGVKAWKFVITYGYIATICGSVITYAVVLFQFVVSSSSSETSTQLGSSTTNISVH